jgi:hypothetical protein
MVADSQPGADRAPAGLHHSTNDSAPHRLVQAQEHAQRITGVGLDPIPSRPLRGGCGRALTGNASLDFCCGTYRPRVSQYAATLGAVPAASD